MNRLGGGTRTMAIVSLFTGAVVGVSLLAAGAPLWVFWLASVAVLPLVVAYLEARRRSGAEDPPDRLPAQAEAETIRSFVSFGEVLPGDPYISLLTPASVYVVSDPDERERLRVNTVRRLGREVVIVTEQQGIRALQRKPRGLQDDLLSTIYGTDVLVGSQAPPRRNPLSPPTLRGARRPDAPPPPDAIDAIDDAMPPPQLALGA